MKTKFIKGTNQQYSIREDGVVISNYANRYSVRVYRTKEMKPNQDGKINFRLGGRKGKSKTLTISNLMKEYFNGVKCHHCDNMVTKKYSKVCNKCRRDIARKTERKWQLNNPDKINKYHKKR